MSPLFFFFVANKGNLLRFPCPPSSLASAGPEAPPRGGVIWGLHVEERIHRLTQNHTPLFAVEKIFSMLSYCASLHPAETDPTPSFMNADGDATADRDAESANPQASLFASMGLDPSSMVFSNPDGSLGGPGLAAMMEQFENGAEGGEEEVQEGEESSAGRQRSDFVNEGRARGAPYCGHVFDRPRVNILP